MTDFVSFLFYDLFQENGHVPEMRKSCFNSDHSVAVDLIYSSSYTCSNGLPPSGPAGS
jgi:hypothetical protein